MKRTIRLTESDLHRVIEESVRQYLTELDWKTYANAAKQADERAMEIARKPENSRRSVHQYNDDDRGEYEKNRKRSFDFANAAKKSFDDEYGYDDGTTKISSDVDIIPRLNGVGAYENGGIWHGDWDDISGEYNSWSEPNIGARFYGRKPERFFNSELSDKNARDAYDKAEDEMGKYYSGKSHYVKGKGWK